jgi:hypothetical protein
LDNVHQNWKMDNLLEVIVLLQSIARKVPDLRN